MSAILVKMPPQMRSTEAPSDSPMAKPMKQGPASSLQKHQDANHEEQFHRHQQQADAHARAQRNAQGGERIAFERGKGGAGIGHRVDADAEPSHAVGAKNAEDGTKQNEDHIADGYRVAGRGNNKPCNAAISTQRMARNLPWVKR